MRSAPDDPGVARRLAEGIALAAAAAELIRHAPDFVADAYCASRLACDSFTGMSFGSLPQSVDARRIAARAAPA
jgi:putative acyl-CoA dehydrogenase